MIDKKIWLLLGLSLLLFGCSSNLAQVNNDHKEKINVMVSIVPQADWVNRIGGDRVQVEIMIPPGADPHTYELTPAQLQALSKTDLYIMVGPIDFEQIWMERIQGVNPDMVVINSSVGIKLNNNDPHIWLSPRRVQVQTKAIYQALTTVDPTGQEDFQRGWEKLDQDLQELDINIAEQLKDIPSREFIVFHPSWSYFASDYGLNELAIEAEGHEPTARELEQLVNYAREHKLKKVFASPEHSIREAETFAREIGGQVVMLDPLAPDYIQNMQSVAQTFASCLGEMN